MTSGDQHFLCHLKMRHDVQRMKHEFESRPIPFIHFRPHELKLKSVCHIFPLCESEFRHLSFKKNVLMPLVIEMHGNRLHFNLIYINQNNFCVRIEPHSHSVLLYKYKKVDAMFKHHFGDRYKVFYGSKHGSLCIEDAFHYLDHVIQTNKDA